MYKNRLQEFTQKSAIPLPEYRTFNEGEAHAPRFRSTVLVDGVAYTSPHSFFHQRASEQDVAKIALEILSKKIESENENEGVSFILKVRGIFYLLNKDFIFHASTLIIKCLML